MLTHFIVSSDVGRSRRFYADVLGGEVLPEGEPTIVALLVQPCPGLGHLVRPVRGTLAVLQALPSTWAARRQRTLPRPPGDDPQWEAAQAGTDP